MKRLGSLLLCVTAVGAPLCALGSPVTVTFDEFGTAIPYYINPGSGEQGIPGGSIDGVTFGFMGTSDQAQYNYDMNIGFTQDMSGAMLEGGTDGTLTLSFATATDILGFDIALETLAPIADGYSVALYDNGTPVLSQSYATTPASFPYDSEGLFSYQGAAVNSAIVTFYNGPDPDNTSQNVSTFAVDNLSFSTPEPATVFLVIAGLAGLVISKSRRSNLA